MPTFVWFSWTGTSPLHSRASYFIPGLKIPDSKWRYLIPNQNLGFLFVEVPGCVCLLPLAVPIFAQASYFIPGWRYLIPIGIQHSTCFERSLWLYVFITNGGVRFLTKFAACVCLSFVGNLHFNFCECYFFCQLTAQIVSFFVHFIQECNVLLFQEFEQSSLGEAALSYILCAFYNT